MSARLECPVCFSDEKEDNQKWVALLPCAHMFHEQCILPWIQTRTKRTVTGEIYTCPVCRAVVPKSVYELGHVPAIAVRNGYLPLKLDFEKNEDAKRLALLELELGIERDQARYSAELRTIEDEARLEYAGVIDMLNRKRTELMSQEIERLRASMSMQHRELQEKDSEIQRLRKLLEAYTTTFPAPAGRLGTEMSESVAKVGSGPPTLCCLDASSQKNAIAEGTSASLSSSATSQRHLSFLPEVQKAAISKTSEKWKGKQRAISPDIEDGHMDVSRAIHLPHEDEDEVL